MRENEKSLYDYVEEVSDRETFIKFVQALIRDREASVAEEKQASEHQRRYNTFGWENGTIESYLDAALSCTEDNADHNPVLFEEPSWKTFAIFLYCGKIYE